MTEAERAELAEINHRIGQIYDKLFIGNGQPSLTQQIAEVRSLHNTCPARLSASNESWQRRISTAMLVIAFLMLLMNYLDRRMESKKDEIDKVKTSITTKDIHSPADYEPSTQWMSGIGQIQNGHY